MFIAKYGRVLEPVKRHIQFQVDMSERAKFTGVCGLNDGLFYDLQRAGVVHFELSDYATRQAINNHSTEPLEALATYTRVDGKCISIRVYKFRKPKANSKSFKQFREPFGYYVV